MTEEIEEILFQLEIVARKHTIKVTDTGNIETMPASVVDELRLNNYSAKILLNCITNLQKENDYYNKKNIELSELNTSLRSDRDNYKSRNEKAVEYIEERKNLNWYADGVFVYELLNILKGGDE